MKSQMTIGKKLFLSFSAALALTLLVGIVSLLSIDSLGTATGNLIKVNSRRLYLAGEVNTITSDIQAEERGILARYYMKDQATMDKYSQAFMRARPACRSGWMSIWS